MKSMKFKQCAISLLALLSLFASTISACACSHHQEKTQTDSRSCHEHSTETKANQNGDDNLLKTIKVIVSETGCICLQPAPKAVAKSENVKVEKHIAGLPAVKPIEIAKTQQIVSAKIDFSKPTYLSDSFYNLSPGRAPPSL